MPIRVTDYLNLDSKVFNSTGAFDTILDIDTKLYISPLLLHRVEIPELSNSYIHIQEHFQKILILLRNSKQKNDRAWREASKLLRFQEPKWLPLGYSSEKSSGRGIGKDLQTQLTNAAKEIIDIGVAEPEIFELMGLIENNIGPDLISDMIASIILPDLLKFSVRIFNKIGINSINLSEYSFKEESYNLPTYHKKGVPIILLPRNILKPLPIMTTWDDIDSVARKNSEVRAQMNELIGKAWSKISTKDKKNALKKILLNQPKLFNSLIENYRNAPPENYDFLEDPEGFVSWVATARDYIKNYPLDLESQKILEAHEVMAVALKICGKFKQLIEDNGLSKELYNEKTLKPRREETAQKLLFAIADSYCEANNIDITRESDAGRGPVDFKFSSGYQSRILIEVKLNKNNPKKGYEKQLEVYKKAEKTIHAIFLVIIVTDNTEEIEKLEKDVLQLKIKGEKCPELVVIDGRIKPSASLVT